MFTGIIMTVGTVRETRPSPGGGVYLVLDAGMLDLDDVAPGHSIAVDGICLTVVAVTAPRIEFDLSRATLNCTAGFTPAAQVNLEKSLRLADRLGGHLMGGHVDGVGRITQFEAVGDNRLLTVATPRELMKYIARKGSIAINGVSLTVNTVKDGEFEVNLIPHTLMATNLSALVVGAKVNLEIDMLARYAERVLEFKD
jgi:riboflavin synthase